MNPHETTAKYQRFPKIDSEIGDSRDMTLAEKLLALQWNQLNHDERYHKEIVLLPVADRMKHFALHMAKYVGYFAEALDVDKDALFERTLIDTFIISLASANTLHLDLGTALVGQESARTDSVEKLGLQLARQPDLQREDRETFLKRFARCSGRLAKACESLDHVESYPFREQMRSSVGEIFKLVITEASLRNIDLTAKAKERLDGIESKNLFEKFRRKEWADR
jgi:hypothetical protein